MKKSILAAKRQKATASIARKLGVNLSVKMKGDTSHKHVRILQLIDESITNTPNVGFALDEILAIDGLSAKSRKAITEALS